MSAYASRRDADRALAPGSWTAFPLTLLGWAVVAQGASSTTFFALSALSRAYPTSTVYGPLLLVAKVAACIPPLATAAASLEHWRRAKNLRTPVWLVSAAANLLAAAAPWIATRSPFHAFLAVILFALATFALVLGLRQTAVSLVRTSGVAPHPYRSNILPIARAEAVAFAERCIRLVALAYTLWSAAEILAMNLEPGDIGWVMMLRFADIYVVAQSVIDCARLSFSLARALAETTSEQT